jgi:hypothetical protein
MGLVVIVLVILVVIAVPIALLAVRLRRGGEPVSGGSMGRQVFSRKDDDWGPKPS